MSTEHHREFIQDKYKGVLVCSCGLAVTYTLCANRPDDQLTHMLDFLHKKRYMGILFASMTLYFLA